MTTYGVISDVHGNLEALRAALDALEARGIVRIVCLGDLVGYNAESNQCLELLAARRVESIAGNHDLIALGRLGLERCSDKPAFTLRRTRRDLTDSSRAHLAALPARRILEIDVALIHGGVTDVQQYITTEARVLENQALLARAEPHATLCFFGHTHRPALYDLHRGGVSHRAHAGRVSLLGHGHAYFINPGSIDASRKAEHNLAEFAVFDANARTVEFCTAPYDHQSVERSAERHGYRMSRADEWLYGVLRLVRRGRQSATRRVTQIWSRTKGSE